MHHLRTSTTLSMLHRLLNTTKIKNKTKVFAFMETLLVQVLQNGSIILNYFIYRRKVSDILQLTVVDLHDLLLQLLLPALLVVEGTLVVLRQSVTVAVDEAALALDTQQSHFLATIETSLAVFLLLLFGLKRELFHSLYYLLLGHANGSGGEHGGLFDYFFLFG